MDNWTREFRLHHLNNFREKAIFSANAQAEWGRWLVASLLVANGGSLLAITQSQTNSFIMLESGGIYFVLGIVSALLCGFLSWLNWTCIYREYEELSDPMILFDEQKEFRGVKHNEKYVFATFWGSVISGAFSAGLFLYACICIRYAFIRAITFSG